MSSYFYFQVNQWSFILLLLCMKNDIISHHFVTDIYSYLIFFQMILCMQFLCSTNPDQFSSLQSLSHVRICDPMDCSTPGFPVFTISWSPLRFTSIESVMPSKHLILCRSLSCSQSFSVLSFPTNQLFTSSGQSIGAWASALASVLPMNIQHWFPLGLTGLLSLKSRDFQGSFSYTTVWKHQFLVTQPSLWSSSHIHMWLLERP